MSERRAAVGLLSWTSVCYCTTVLLFCRDGQTDRHVLLCRAIVALLEGNLRTCAHVCGPQSPSQPRLLLLKSFFHSKACPSLHYGAE
eukprot:scaffold261020_cov26-Tisochrysis_lutea.AAC.1